MFAAIIDLFMYKRKEKPKKAQVTCPHTQKVLLDFELFHGRCSTCIRMHTHHTQGPEYDAVSEIQKCQQNIFKQCQK